MEISKIKLTWKYLTGGVDGVVEYILDQFNSQVLSKASPDILQKYCSDIKSLSAFVTTVIDNHGDGWGANRTSAAKAIVLGLGDLAHALSDSKLTKTELDSTISSLKEIIALFGKKD